MQHFVALRGISALVSLLVLLQPSIGDDRAAFFDLLARRPPLAGAVAAVFAQDGATSFGEIAVGYDSATGAWYDARPGGFFGRSPSGSLYRKLEHEGTVQFPKEGEHYPIALLEFLPGLWLDYLAKRKDEIESVHTRGGAFIVRIELRGPGGHPVDLEIDPQGTVLRAFAHRAHEVTEYEYQIIGSAGGIAVSAHHPLRPAMKCVSHEHVTGDAADRFTPEHVAAIAAKSRLNQTKALAAKAQGFETTNDGSWVQGNAPSRSNPWARYRPALLATALLVLVVGIIGIIRRRSTA